MTVIKKGSKWYYRFQLNGKEYYRACKGATNFQDALMYEAVVKSDIMRGDLRVLEHKQKINFENLVKIFLEYSKANKQSYKTDVYFCNSFISFFGRHKLIDEIKPADIEAYKIHRLNHVKPASINRELNSLKKMFNIAVENEFISISPGDKVKKIGRVESRKKRVLSKEEEILIYNTLGENHYLTLIIKVALLTAMRIGEILNLKWENVDFKEGWIHVMKTKNGKPRSVPMASALKELLFSLKRDNDYVFYNPKTNKPYRSITKAFNLALKSAKIENFTFHDLRHTAATRMAAEGVDLITLAEILGHSDLKMVKIYAHSAEELKKRAIAVLNKYFKDNANENNSQVNFAE